MLALSRSPISRKTTKSELKTMRVMGRMIFMKYICLGYLEPGKFENMSESERNTVQSSPYRINDPWLSCRLEANALIEQEFELASDIRPVKRASVQ